MSIGSVRIADYGYNTGNGSLDHIYYGFIVEPLASVSYGYDLLGRMAAESWYEPASGKTKVYGYNYSSDGNLAGISENGELTYSYDAVGNITKVLSGSTTLAEYTYDSRGQLLSEDDGKYYTTYTYDTYGNIRSAWVRASEDHNFVYGVYNYTYNDNGLWKDQLKGYSYQNYYGDISSFSGNLTYDVLGNPLTYFNGNKTWNFTWEYGRQLASTSDGTHTITNEYDVDGVRESKTVDGVKHEYITLDGKIIRETYGNTTVDYFYDNEGKPYKLQVSEGNGTYTGYYVMNQQGDVIAILNANGVKVVSYEYNAWGKVVDEASYDSITGPLFLEHNALKYRRYYYDADLGLYYLGTRFYDPAICRFINADTTDVLMANPSSLTDKNLYSYCDNNPVMRKDDGGEFWNIAAGAVIGGIISMATQVVTNVVTGERIDSGVLLAGVSGAVSGAFSASGLGRAGQIACNALISEISEAINQRIEYKKSPENFNLGKAICSIGVSTRLGALAGRIGGDGARVKGSNYKKALNNLASVENKIKNNCFYSSTKANKALSLAKSWVQREGRAVTVTTSARFFTGAKIAQYGTSLWKFMTRRWK